ncbi:glycosyltransferase family 2 protein [Pelagicoccus albus]|uniref:Glycosyltransferase n=1 Tax=Pelagicoccus albus TaxID=415222 RepID=A0A7X1B9U7_9BACT|nr:glycosyltransferase [Pelagicoccus albus]MBC2608251.1 glycosyltransferase [Pelagicoccus albus]
MSQSKSTDPEISVIVPVFNTGAFLRGCIESILAQTYSSLEVVVVNDASPDDSLSILKDMAEKDSRIVIVDKKENGGIHAARADGFKVARGSLIAFADSDDGFDPDLLEKLRDTLVSNDADISICGARMVDPKGAFLGIKMKMKDQVLDGPDAFEAFCKLQLGSGTLWNKLFKREIIEPHSMSDWGWRAGGVEDTLVNIGCFSDAKKVACTSYVGYNYLIHPNMITQSAGPGKAYARHLHAYATALNHYKDLPEEKIALIDTLYRGQLEMPVYHVSDPAELKEFEDQLLTAVEIISRVRPSSLWEIANLGLSCPKSHILHESSCKKWIWALRQTVRSLKKKLRGKK